MANGPTNPFTAFAIGFQNPAALMQERRQRDQMRAALLQTVLERTPIDAPNRPELEAQFGQLTGVHEAGLAFRPQQQQEQFTALGAQQRLIGQRPGQDPRVVIPAQQGAGDPAFGKSQSSLAMEAVMRARAKQRQGVPLTAEDRDQLAFARNILNAPRIIQGPGGSLIQAQPVGVPPQLESVFDEAGEDLGRTRGGVPIEKVSRQVRTGQFELTELKGAKSSFEKDFNIVLDTASDIAELLEAGRSEFGGVTGLGGTIKAEAGGALRQLGIPVSGRAKQIKRKLETTKAIAARHLLGETGRTLSDGDRRRLDAIVGTMDALTDEQDIREAIIEVVEIMSRMQQ